MVKPDDFVGGKSAMIGIQWYPGIGKSPAPTPWDGLVRGRWFAIPLAFMMEKNHQHPFINNLNVNYKVLYRTKLLILSKSLFKAYFDLDIVIDYV